MRILGIDPGSTIVGYGVLEKRGDGVVLAPHQLEVVDAGVIRSNPKVSFLSRLSGLYKALSQIVKEITPEIYAVESAFVGHSAGSALKLGQARGVLMATAIEQGIPVVEVSPTEVKRVVVGKGHASKELVSLALKRLIDFDRGGLPLDASDAVAIALTAALKQGVQFERGACAYSGGR